MQWFRIQYQFSVYKHRSLTVKESWQKKHLKVILNTSLMINLVSLTNQLLSLRYASTKPNKVKLFQYKILLQVIYNNEKDTGVQKNWVWVIICLLIVMWNKAIFLMSLFLPPTSDSHNDQIKYILGWCESNCGLKG